ncbi:BppU family phage baseplate upper protein [Listeria innocua]|uniref:BppU family phage baseplate upper protein n=1 Tax=Listeria innocua TaxID=1642 RepID=A0AB73HB74_LISIO|nr:BppU family phage baseplate upper protein [Listeria innocua]MBC2142839.1 BppU family phage baseplate upper protein [Listeria innocua]
MVNSVNKIFKSGIFNFEANAEIVEASQPNIHFSTQDTGSTAQLVFNLTKDEGYLPLSAAATIKLIMIMSDTSRYIVNPEIIDRVNGQAVYSLTDEQLTHIGSVKCELYVNYPIQGMQISKFSFMIDQALIDSDITSIITYYVQKWDEWEAYFQAQMDALNNELDMESARLDIDIAELDAKMDTEFEKFQTEADELQQQFDSFNPAQFAQKTDLDNHVNDIDIHVTTSDKTNWNGKETVEGAEAKANTAVIEAALYTDSYFASIQIASPGAIYLTDTQSYSWDHSKMKKGIFFEVVRYVPGTGAADYGYDEIFISKYFIEKYAGKSTWMPMPSSSSGEKKVIRYSISGDVGTLTGYASNSVSPDNGWAFINFRME